MSDLAKFEVGKLFQVFPYGPSWGAATKDNKEVDIDENDLVVILKANIVGPYAYLELLTSNGVICSTSVGIHEVSKWRLVNT